MAFNPDKIVMDSVERPKSTGKFNPDKIAPSKVIEPEYSTADRLKFEAEAVIPAAKESAGKLAELAFSSFTDAPTRYVEEMGDIKAAKRAEHERKFGKDKWNVGETVGELTPDIGAAVLSRGKSIPYQMGLEGVLSSARNRLLDDDSRTVVDKASDVGLDAVLAGAGAKVADMIFPAKGKTVDTELGKEIKKMTPDRKAFMDNMLDKTEAMGIEHADNAARTQLLDDTMKGITSDSKEVSERVLSELSENKDIGYSAKRMLYNQAHEIARQTDSIETRGLIPDIQKEITGTSDVVEKSPWGGTGTTATKASRKLVKEEKLAMREVETTMRTEGGSTAEGLEGMIQDLKSSQRAATSPRAERVYQIAIDRLQTEQTSLLKGIGKENIYEVPRRMHKQLIKDFEGKGVGTGIEAGKKVASVLEAQNNYEVALRVLGKGVDVNTADQIAKQFSRQTRRDMVMSVLADKVGKLDTAEGTMKLLRNFQKADPNGMKVMLGEEGYNKLKQNMDAITYVQSVLSDAGKEADSMFKDFVELAGASAASNISPYASMHVAINASKNIFKKGFRRKESAALLKRARKVLPKKTYNQLANGISMMLISGVDAQEN